MKRPGVRTHNSPENEAGNSREVDDGSPPEPKRSYPKLVKSELLGHPNAQSNDKKGYKINNALPQTHQKPSKNSSEEESKNGEKEQIKPGEKNSNQEQQLLTPQKPPNNPSSQNLDPASSYNNNKLSVRAASSAKSSINEQEVLKSMREYSSRKLKKIKTNKISYEEKDKKILLSLSSDYYTTFNVRKEKNHPREFDTLTKYKPAREASDSKNSNNSGQEGGRSDHRNGFENTNVYCYLNAVIQFLLSAEGFVDQILESSHFTRKISQEETKFSYNLQKYLRRNQSKDLDTMDITNYLWLFKDYLELDHQQDAHEFMRLMLDKVHEELKPRFKGRGANAYKYSWDSYKVHEVSPVSTCFAGELTRTTMCFNCFEINEHKESILELSLNVEEDFETLEDSLEDFFRNELIDDDYECGKCRMRAPASSKIFLSRFPKYLNLHLKRFSFFPHRKIEHLLPPKNKDLLELSK